jgi:sugar phosphate isomerase/epimerase
VAAIGRDAEALCRGHWKAELGHGPETPYMRLAERGGYVCLLGVDQDRSTMLHVPEELLRLPYLRRTAEKTFDTPEGTVTRSWPFFPGPHRDFIGLDSLLRQRGVMKEGRLGNAVVRLMRAREAIDVLVEEGRKNPAFALCPNPNCAACVQQRADLHRARWARESFTLAAAASLAGRYIEEIVDNCRAAGVDAVELDALKGRPLAMHSADDVGKAIDALRAAALRPVSLRVGAVADKIKELVSVAAAEQVGRLVVPLSHRAPDHAAWARDAGVRISFFNLGIGGVDASTLLTDLRERKLDVGFTFSAANFARAGENPFLRAYRQKLRRFVDQLDVEDARFDGASEPLARGHAEIKEMVSILRAGGFKGLMVLGAGNLAVGSLRDAAERFAALLDAM